MNTKRIINHFLAVVEKQPIPLYCDPRGRPFIELPLDPQNRPWPLRSQTVRSWICTMCFQELLSVPSSGDVESVLNVLEGYALQRMQTIEDSGLLVMVEEDSLLQAILEFMNSLGLPQHTELMTGFMKKLKDQAKTSGLLDTGKRKWPGASWVLSNRLKELMPILTRLGISVTIKHTNQGSEVTLKKLASFNKSDATSVTASPMASSQAGPDSGQAQHHQSHDERLHAHGDG